MQYRRGLPPELCQPLRATLRANSALRPTSSPFRVLAISSSQPQHNKTTTQYIHPSIAAKLPELDTYLANDYRSAFRTPSRAHWDEKGHRLSAPVALPPRVNVTAPDELLQPHTATKNSTGRLRSLATSPHCRRRAPRSRRHAPARQHRNNGLNTASNVAPRAYTPYAYARPATRQLRALLSPPFKAQHCAKQSIRLSSLWPPS